MLKEHLRATALTFFTVPEQFELFIDDFDDEEATFMWKEKDSDEGYYVKLDANGKLISLSQPASQNGVRITVKEQERIAKHFLHTQYEAALDYFTLSKVNENEDGTQFKFEQFVGHYPLASFYCFITISHYGEVLDFNFRGYTTNPPLLPETLASKEKMYQTLFTAHWKSNIEYLSSDYYSVPNSGLHVLYESPVVHLTFNAETGDSQVENFYDDSNDSFAPFPETTIQARETTTEKIIGVPYSMEIVRQSKTDEQLQQIVWREKNWQAPDDKSMENFLLSRYEESVKAEISTSTNQLKGFVWFKQRQGNLDLTYEQCRQIAAQFIATYYEEFVPYLLVKIEEPSFNDLQRAMFIFPISVEGYRMDGDFFMVCVNKTTGLIDMLMTPDTEISTLEAYTPVSILELSIAKQALKDVDVFLQWEKNYDTDEPIERLKYSFGHRKTKQRIKGIDAVTGNLITKI